MVKNTALRTGLLLLVLGWVLSVAGCSPATPAISHLLGEQPVQAAAPTQVPQPTATATVRPQPSATATPLPTATWTPAPTATSTPAPSATPSAAPTFPPPPLEVHAPILMYHYISELPADADRYRVNLTVPPARFEEQLRYLQEQGYHTVTLTDLYETLTTGKPLPEKPIVLTFDDGYEDAYSQAMPLLQQYGFVGEFFVLATPAHYQAPNYLSWEQMRLMAEGGMSLQAHGRDHYDLTNRDYDFLVYQILGAREAVEAHAGQPVRFFCYPSGRYDAATQAVVESAGYFGAVTTKWGATQRLDNRYAWPRIRINGTWALEEFARVLKGLQ